MYECRKRNICNYMLYNFGNKEYISLIMIFLMVHFEAHTIQEAPPGTLGLVNISGWMTSNLFI
jgi:hypothetical protein